MPETDTDPRRKIHSNFTHAIYEKVHAGGMKLTFAAMAIISSLAACASLEEQERQEASPPPPQLTFMQKMNTIGEGTSSVDLLEIAGQPVSQRKARHGDMVWSYADRYHLCNVTLGSNGIVKDAPVCGVDQAQLQRDTAESQSRLQQAEVDIAQAQMRQQVLNNLAQTYSNRQSFGQIYLQQQNNNPPPPSPPPFQPVFGGRMACGFKPMSTYGCHYVCINGSWMNVCN